jgi:hypothetical protein
VVVFLLFLLTGAVFGFDVWFEFWTKTRPLMTGIMNAPFPTGYQVRMVTVFAAIRSLGLSLPEAQIAQFVMTGGCIFLCWRLWRPGATVDPVGRVCVTLVLVLLATPYAYDYDSVAVSAACLHVLMCRKTFSILLPTFALAAPLLLYYARTRGVFVDPLELLALVVYFLWQMRDRIGSSAPEGKPAERWQRLATMRGP